MKGQRDGQREDFDFSEGVGRTFRKAVAPAEVCKPSPGFILIFSVHTLITTNHKTSCVSILSITLPLNHIQQRCSQLREAVDIMWCLCLSPPHSPWFPPARPYGRWDGFYWYNVGHFVGLAAGEINHLLCWITVMCVMSILFLDHFVCQIVEKNKLKKLAEMCLLHYWL